MREVAERAGVALSSVSRVLSGHADVSPIMRNRVLDTVAALGYEPDLLAQSLRKGATMTIGFVLGDISNPLMSQIGLGAEVVLREAGYSMLLTNSINDPALDVRHLKLLQQRRVDGVLLSLSDESNTQTKLALERLDIPWVLVDRQIQGQPSAAVLSDHAAGIEAAASHLAGLGHRRIGLVNLRARDVARPDRERANALRKVCRQIPGLTCLVRTGGSESDHGQQSTIELLREADRPTALIAGSNQILVGVLRALRELKLKVPDNISLVTCDDVPLSEFLEPAISTISRDPREMGAVAAQLLLEQLSGKKPRIQLLPTGFRPTASCAPAQRPPRAKGNRV